MHQLGQMLLLFFFLVSCFSVLPALPVVLPEPDPAPVQQLPFLSSSPPATIPALPEQSDATGACPLDLSGDLLRGLPRACSAAPGAGGLPSRSRCCPALAARLLAAYSATALAARPLPAASYDLPVLPDDSESCAAGVEAALRARGAELPRGNGTCDVVYCYCGVRLRRLTCAGSAFVASVVEGRWVATEETARRLEEDCARPGLAGCTRCLRTLNQLVGSNVTGASARTGGSRDNECQLMGLTWLLTRNRTLFLPAATAVLRTFMAAPDDAPKSCALTHDDMPIAVDSAQLDAHGASPAVRSPTSLRLLLLLLTVVFSLFF